MSYKFSKTSQDRLDTCHFSLRLLMNLALSRSPVDFGIAEGHRSLEMQKQLFDEGKSKIDGIKKKGKHNLNPSQAVDIYAWVSRKASWDPKTLCIIAGVIYCCAKELGIRIRWGGNWDMDGEIITDQGFVDLPHIELL